LEAVEQVFDIVGELLNRFFLASWQLAHYYLHTNETPGPGVKSHELQVAQPPPLPYQFQLLV